MAFLPLVRVVISGDTVMILIRQRYRPRGKKVTYRWVIACECLLSELKEEERRQKREAKKRTAR